MNNIFYVQYDSNENITNITQNDMYGNTSWTMVSIPSYLIDYFKANYGSVKYDTVNKALLYPDNAIANNTIIQNNQTQFNGIESQVQANQNDINSLKRRMDWNHVIQVFTIPMDLDFLNSAYGLSVQIGGTTITAYPINGIFTLPPNCGMTFSDAPTTIDYANGFTMKVTVVNTTFVYVKLIDKNGIYSNHYTIGQSIDTTKWKTLDTFGG